MPFFSIPSSSSSSITTTVADWETYSSFSKISENKTENRSKNTRPRKVLRGLVFYILFCILFFNFSRNGKHAAAQNFTRYLLDKVKMNCFEVNYR